MPETLHALVAARLDGLTPVERQVVQDVSVLGQSFTATGVAVLSERAESEIVPVLEGLIAKQVLSRDEDPRSPERGQYAFVQALLRTVAYGTLGRRARKQRHLAAAGYLEGSWPGGLVEIAEVLASHYLEAIRRRSGRSGCSGSGGSGAPDADRSRSGGSRAGARGGGERLLRARGRADRRPARTSRLVRAGRPGTAAER
ncbi:MAG TPA: hypothetical protein VG275_10335 [Solirubrobacteraceae bacterium]|nr:hypothetical protein [Solirubrobacteraceae bacterium]